MMKTKLKFFLVFLAMMVGGVNGAWAQSPNETYDFEYYQEQGATFVMGDSYAGIANTNVADNVTVGESTIADLHSNFPIRFAFLNESYNGWYLNKENGAQQRHGLRSWNTQLAIRNLWNGDRIKVYFVGMGISFRDASSAKVNNTFVTAGQQLVSGEYIAAVRNGDIVIVGAEYTWITKIEFYYQNGSSSTTNVNFVNPPSTMNVGDEFNTNNSGISITPSTATPVFSSSNTNVVTVDKYGYVKAVGPGTATITANLQIGPQGNQYASSSSDQFTVTVPYSDAYAHYEYDPAIEIYDLSGQNGTSYDISDADFQLNNFDAVYLTNLNSGLSLNNRVAVNKNSDNNTGHWFFEYGLKVQWSHHNVSICNLKEGDRVRITYEGTAVFSSAGTSATYNGCSAYKDFVNNGYFDEADDQYIAGGTAVVNNTFYTITEDGHLDIGLANGSKITKIEIIGDHQAIMLDKYNGTASSGYTAYFSSTGQLMAKEHKVPGGLEVHIGNTDDSQHAIVVSSDKGPVSFVYDQDGYKMARRSDNSTDLAGAAPSTGTFYKFMPEVNGTMTVKLKAYSVKYDSYIIGGGHGKDTGNEHQVTGYCPYYLMIQDGNSYTQYSSTSKNNGADVTFTDVPVTAGKVYYVYGGWADPSNYTTSICGVAELIDVTFIPAHSISRQAKWVANATYDSSTGTYYDNDLADVSGVTTSELHIKKKSSNITSCTAYIDGGKLKINNITFVDATKGGGTILIKLGNGEDDPVFAYTIAYKASYNSGEGHKWNFSDNSLKGLKWTNTSAEATVTPFGTAGDNTTPSLLYEQMHPASGTSDWTFAYRVKIGDGGNDPMYLNKNPMSGNNANFIWDTEGLIINTGSNQSCINNEYTNNKNNNNAADHSVLIDPDRYVGILPGGSFTIPQLDAGDRVVIFMGSGFGSGNDACKFNITGALDAIGKQISSSDIYNAGGSEWVNGGGTNTYRGAYQFISTGGDMTFTMNGGSMTKLYSIEIYSGVKSGTVDATRGAYDITFGGDEYLAADNAWYMRNDFRTTTPARSAYTLHYRGKGERLRLPTVVYKNGNINTDGDHLKYGTVGDNSAPFFFFKSEKEQYGMIRMRIDCMELNNNYVADYGMQNLTVGWLQKKTYPYTWDFTDLMGYVNNNNRIQGERTKVDGYALGQNGYLAKTTDGAYTTDNEFMNNTVGTGVKAVEQWKYYTASGNIPAGYGLHVRNEPYNGGVMWSGGELYAGSEAFGETFGLSFEPTGVDQSYNGGLRICNDGIYITGEAGKNWKIKVPLVGSNETPAAIYVRAHEIGSDNVVAGVGNASTAFTYVGTATDNTGDKIYAVSGTGNDIDLIFNNHVIKKIAVSEDAKQFNAKGWTTESRLRDIDPSLTAYMTGHNIKTYLVTNVTYSNKTVELTEIGSNTTTDKLMHKSTANDDEYACILRNDADAQLNIVNSSFHLFAPDMHDEQGETPGTDYKKKNYYTTKTSKMKSRVNGGFIAAEADGFRNYALSYQYYDVDPDDGSKVDADQEYKEGAVAFYRIVNSGANSSANKGYLPVSISGSGGSARFSFVFADNEDNQVSGIMANKDESMDGGNTRYFNLNGQQLSGKPNRQGLYIVNGKKMYIK